MKHGRRSRSRARFDAECNFPESGQQVRAFAAKVGVSLGAVVGMLWHERLWAWDEVQGSARDCR